MNRILIILKSGKEINVSSPTETVRDLFSHMNLAPGSCLNIGDSFILCSEIAAVMDANSSDQSYVDLGGTPPYAKRS